MRIFGCISEGRERQLLLLYPSVEKLNSIVQEEIRLLTGKISFALETVHATSFKSYQITTFSTTHGEMDQQPQSGS